MRRGGSGGFRPLTPLSKLKKQTIKITLLNATIMSSAVLDPPTYSPSSDAPVYAAEPTNGEERLEFVARGQNRNTPDGTFTKKSGGVTVVLADQDDNATIPSYSRNGVVRGDVLLDDEKVLAVAVKVRYSTPPHCG